MHIAIAEPVIALRAGALCCSGPARLPTRVCRQVWLNRLERRVERAATRLDRAGLLDNDGRAARHD